MDSNTINCIKRKIKSMYLEYSSEDKASKTTILDIANLFNIQLEKNRLDDYVIQNIELEALNLSILDKKTNTLYKSEFTEDADLLNYSYSGNPRFIKVKKLIHNLVVVEILYLIGRDEPLAEKITFSKGDYELVFERQYSHSIGLFSNNGIKQAVRYIVNDKDLTSKEFLLNKIVKYKYRDEPDYCIFEQLYTYGNKPLVEYCDNQDKYSYTYLDNVVYGINKLDIHDTKEKIRGICFEKLKRDDIEEHLPRNINIQTYPELIVQTNLSGIIFIGKIGKNEHHGLKILKSDGNINLKYISKNRYRFENNEGLMEYSEEILAVKDRNYPAIDDGTITSRELRNIIPVLESEYKDDEFIKTIINELYTFANKIDLRNGLIKENLDMLSPKIFINMSSDEIVDYISKNLDEYFKLIDEQFQDATHVKVKNGTIKKLVIK